MSIRTIEEIKQSIDTVRNETVSGGNTKTRIGDIYEDIIDSLTQNKIYVTSLEGCADDADLSLGSTTFGTDNHAALQAILDKAQTSPITILVDGRYSVSQALEVYSNTKIVGMDGCGFILRNNSNTPVIQNANIVAPVAPWDNANVIDHDITLDNLIINGNGYNTGPGGSDIFDVDAGGSAVNGSAQMKRIPTMDFSGVKRLKETNLKVWGARYFSMNHGNCKDVFVQNIETDHGEVSDRDDYNYDGIHFTGSCYDITVKDVKCRNNKDDAVAFVSGSAAAVDPRAYDGPIKRVYVENVVLDSKALGISIICTDQADAECSDIFFKGIRGSTHSILGRIQNYASGPSKFGNITIEDVNVEVGTDNSVQSMGGMFNLEGEIDNIIFKNLFRESFTNGKSWFVTSSETEIKNITIDGITMKSSGGTFASPFFHHKGGSISQMNIKNFYHWESTSDINAPIIQVENSVVKLDTVFFENIITFNVSSIINSLETTAGYWNSVFANNVIHASGSAAAFVANNTVANLYLNNFLGTTIFSGTFTNKKGSAFDYGDVTVASLPSVTQFKYCFVTDESGGAVPAFSDGVNWRRVTDRAIVS